MTNDSNTPPLNSAWSDLSKEFRNCRKIGRPTYAIIDLLIVFLNVLVRWFFGTAFDIMNKIQKPILRFLIPRTYFNPKGDWP